MEGRVEQIENVLNTTIFGDSSKSIPLPDDSVHICVTSPPYNVDKDYGNYKDDKEFKEYVTMLNDVWAEVYRVLIPGGRICINVANTGRKPYIPLNSFIVFGLLEAGFMLIGDIIWNKGASAGSSTAWGSWLSASSPSLRDVHEYIIVGCKESYKRIDGDGKESTISSKEFSTLTKSVWNIKTENTSNIPHPCPYPIQLVYNLLRLFSFKDDIVLDPFMGSG